MNGKPVIAIVGTGQEMEASVYEARELGRLIAEKGWILVTGGRNGGVMKAANEGAKEAGGLTVGILPDRKTEVSPDVDVAIITDTGEAVIDRASVLKPRIPRPTWRPALLQNSVKDQNLISDN